MNGSINKAPTKKIPHFDLEVPTELEGVATNILDPRDTYANAADWEKKALDLSEKFIKNFKKYENNEKGKALVAAVNHSGDSDSTGAVTGNILGAALGESAIPAKFLEKLELRDIIREVADDLYNDCKMTEYGDYRDPVWTAKYIAMSYPVIEKWY